MGYAPAMVTLSIVTFCVGGPSPVGRERLDLLRDIHAGDDVTEARVLGRELRSLGAGDDEELGVEGAVGIGARFRGRERADRVAVLRDLTTGGLPEPPLPSPFGSPPWMTKSGTTRWNVRPS